MPRPEALGDTWKEPPLKGPRKGTDDELDDYEVDPRGGARRDARRLQLAPVAGCGRGEAFGVLMKRAVGGNMGIYGNTKDEVIHRGWPACRLTAVVCRHRMPLSRRV